MVTRQQNGKFAMISASRSNQSFVRAAFSGAVALATVFALAPPANAGVRDLHFYSGGVLKAQGTYDDANNRICVRAYHSSPRAWALFSFDGAVEDYKVDYGGDTAQSCKVVNFPASQENTETGFNLYFYSENGAQDGGDFAVGTS